MVLEGCCFWGETSERACDVVQLLWSEIWGKGLVLLGPYESSVWFSLHMVSVTVLQWKGRRLQGMRAGVAKCMGAVMGNGGAAVL